MLTRPVLRNAVVAAAALALAPFAYALPGANARKAPDWVDPLYAFQDTRPTTGATDVVADQQAGSLAVEIGDVVGMVQVSTDGKKTWQRATKGMRVTQGATFRTGVRSSVTCFIGDKQTFTVESLSTLTVLEATQRGPKVTTDLVMPYGATSYGVEAAGTETDGRIHTPSSTLAVRGTVVRSEDRAPFAPTAESFTGRALFRTAQRQSASLGGRQYATITGNADSAAQTALNKTVVDPSIAGARTTSESRYIADQVSRGATFQFDTTANIPVVRNGPGPLPDENLANNLPGRLSFALRWTGNADLNILVDNQAGDQLGIITGGFVPQEILFPGFGLNTSNSGGKIPYDDRGGPRGGMEIGYWEDSFPTGVYGIGALHASGGSANFVMNAFLDKQPLNLYFFQGVDADGFPKLVKSASYKGTLGPDGADAVILFAPNNATFETITEDADPNFVDDGSLESLARKLLAQSESGKPVATAAKPKPISSDPGALQRVAKNKLNTTQFKPGKDLKAKGSKAPFVGPKAKGR